MNCRDARKRIVDLLDPQLDQPTGKALLEHVDSCPDRAPELEEARDTLEALRPWCKIRASAGFKERTMQRIADIEAETSAGRGVPNRGAWTRRLAWAATGVAIWVCFTLGYNLFVARNDVPAISAFSVLVHAAETMSGLKSIHIKAKIRSRAQLELVVIDLNADFVPIEIWKVYGVPPQWRMQKPRRVVVMDGYSTQFLMQPGDQGDGPPMALKIGPGQEAGLGWLQPLLDVEQLLEREVSLAEEQGSTLAFSEVEGTDGRAKRIVTVSAHAQGDFTQSDAAKNSTIVQSDNIRIYTFDEKTGLLEHLQVHLFSPRGEILVFETTQIEYDVAIDPSVFVLNAPPDTVWERIVSVSQDESIRDLSPKEAAHHILAAFSREDWETLRQFSTAVADHPLIRKVYGGLSVVNVGEPYKSGTFPGWFVPYQIKLSGGEMRKGKLVVRRHPQGESWLLTGGL